MEGPCDGWSPTIDASCAGWAGLTPDQQAYALRFATWVVWAGAGRRHGLCSRTVRPCQPSSMPLYMTYPVGDSGEGFWSLQGVPGGVQLYGSCCSGGCQCSPSQVALPAPVSSITSVVIDGVTRDPSTYQLQAGYLVSLTDPWPTSQDYSVPSGPGSWSVTYLQGDPVPDLLNDAAGMYACEIAGSLGSGLCRLPNRVQQVTRQGVTIEYVDSGTYLDENRTGVVDVDLILQIFNPYRRQQAPRFLSPDMPQMR